MDSLEPLEAAVLVAISKGLDDPRKLAEVLRVREDDVRSTIERLIARGLVEKVEKRGILRRRVELRLTREGYNLLPQAMRILEEVSKKARKILEEAKRSGGEVPREALGPELIALLPLLGWLGLIPLELLLVMGLLEDSILADFIGGDEHIDGAGEAQGDLGEDDTSLDTDAYY